MSDSLNLELQFEGFLQCRLATDPDPPSETRGVSGYTFAVAGESPLDQIIRLQRDEIEDRNFREPFPPYLEEENPDLSVRVRRVLLDGQPSTNHCFDQANVRWLGSPVFEIRNQIVADGTNQLIPVISPFEIEIAGLEGALLRRFDPLDPCQPEAEIWELSPEQYRRRVPVNYFDTGSEALAKMFPELREHLHDASAINSFYNAYFEARKAWLQLQISQVVAEQVDSSTPASPDGDLQVEGFRTRIYSIDQHTSTGGSNAPAGRMENRLGLQTVWEHDVVGTAIADNIPGGTIATDEPWRTRFWISGWDGDLLVGYLAGSLKVPFVPD